MILEEAKMFKEKINAIKNDFDTISCDDFDLIKFKLDRSFDSYRKNIQKNINYLLCCRSSDKVRRYLDERYSVNK